MVMCGAEDGGNIIIPSNNSVKKKNTANDTGVQPVLQTESQYGSSFHY